MFNVISVLVLIIFDVITGLLKSAKNGCINSTAIRSGLYHKISEILCVLFCLLFDKYAMQLGINLGINLATCAIIYICTAEIISIVENLCELNPALKGIFAPFLSKLKGVDDDETKGKGN